MNIFVLDNDPITSAEMMCDKHIPKLGFSGLDYDRLEFTAAVTNRT